MKLFRFLVLAAVFYTGISLAVGISEDTTSSDLTSAESYYKRAVSYFESSIASAHTDLHPIYDASIQLLTKAIELNPNYMEAFLMRGNMHSGNGNYDKAISDYTTAIELSPRSANAYYERGYSYVLKVEYWSNPGWPPSIKAPPTPDEIKDGLRNAAADFSKAIEIDPSYIRAYESRQYCYYNLGDYENSWIDMHKIKELSGTLDPVTSQRLLLLKEKSGREK